MPKRFVLLQSRPEKLACDDEYQAFLRFSGLAPSDLEAIDMISRPWIDLDKYQAVIMGGGPLNFATPESEKANEQQELEDYINQLMRRIIDLDKPFFGACLGVGALVSALGGQMSFANGEPVRATDIDINQPDKLLDGVPRTFRAFVGHKEGAYQLPDSVALLASSKTCPQLIKVRDNVYASQFHPELDAAGLALRLRLYKNMGYADPDEVEDLIAAAKTEQIPDAARPLKNFVKIYG